MKLQLPIQEAISLVKTKTGKVYNLKIVNSNTVNVRYEAKVRVPVFGEISKQVDIDVTIEKVINDTLYLRYRADGKVANLLLKGLIAISPSLSAKQIIEPMECSRLLVHLAEIEETRNVLEKMTINNIVFSNGNAEIDFNLK